MTDQEKAVEEIARKMHEGFSVGVRQKAEFGDLSPTQQAHYLNAARAVYAYLMEAVREAQAELAASEEVQS